MEKIQLTSGGGWYNIIVTCSNAWFSFLGQVCVKRGSRSWTRAEKSNILFCSEVKVMKNKMIAKMIAKIFAVLCVICVCFCFAGCNATAPYIGADGYWYVNGQKTDCKAQGGQGEQGEQGDKGEKGDKGDSGAVLPENTVDLVMFMGQSNMAGRGVAEEATVLEEGQGYEFRAITDPTKLYHAEEPFGKNENNSTSGVSETTKTGGMVTSFMSEYYKSTGVPIVGVSCSKGGTQIEWWGPDGAPLTDAISRYTTAVNYLESNDYTIRHRFMVWCQGESDGDNGVDKTTYRTRFESMINKMMEQGIEKTFVVRIGNLNGDPTKYDPIIEAQTEYCRESGKAVLVTTKLAGFAAEGLMKDSFHYKQEGYNIAGKDAGKNAAYYANTGIEPCMYDVEYGKWYYPYPEITGVTGGNTSADNSCKDGSCDCCDCPKTYTEKKVEFNFTDSSSDGIDWSQYGALSGGKLTVSSAQEITLPTPITVSLDESFTLECTVQTTGAGGTLLTAGVSTGGFLNIPSARNDATSNGFTLRDTNKTVSLFFTKDVAKLGQLKHLIMIYDKDAGTIKAYEDGVEMTLVNQVGSIVTLKKFAFTKMFGGFNAGYAFVGDIYHFRYVNRALTQSEWNTAEATA